MWHDRKTSVVILNFTIGVSLAASARGSDGPIIYAEDFEDGSYPGLILVQGTVSLGSGLNGSSIGLHSPSGGGDGTRLRIDLLRSDNFLIEADFQIVSNANGDFNLWVNSTEANHVDGYRGNVNPLGGDNTDALIRLENSNGQLVDGRPQTIGLGETHHLRMLRQGSTVQVFLDGAEYLSYTDPNPLDAGQMGLIAGIGHVVIDNVVVRVASEMPDCNHNGIPDPADLANCDGSTGCGDCNGNGILDECELLTAQGWILNPANGHSYRLTSAMGSWASAEAEAQADGGHLVAISDQAEQDWLVSMWPLKTDPNLWIGLHLVNSEWEWSSWEPVSYTNWLPNEPNGDGGVAEMNHYKGFPGQWNDEHTSNEYGIIERMGPFAFDCNGNGVPDECDGFVCDDGNPCTIDECIGVTCVFTPATVCGPDDGCCPSVDCFSDIHGDVDCPSSAIPTVSEWGLVTLSLLLAAAGKVYFGVRPE